ncbi:T9SS C-terminal target domain-containing protein [Paludibacter sp. 221]|uniref:type IX secretion system sortase PorU n=1 Tax=Paludibacter sp. 221 TaxID=2302939 RepID=UPI0013D16209|nr:type IX secretion system sortase PorU [Paludibacter sp. 221]NDV46643.1 T9SS C-terminal target domain-containing protein [Paludibacter sp. 221]
MRNKLYLLSFFITSVTFLMAQPPTTVPVQLHWRGIERWYADSSYVETLTFDNAVHSVDNNLPYFHYEEMTDPSFTYTAEIKNANYIPVSEEESLFLSNIELPAEPGLDVTTSNYRSSESLHINFLPFVIRDNKPYKLNAFDLVIQKSVKSRSLVRASTIHSYANESVLSQGRFVKIRVKDSGVYRISHAKLRENGLEPSNVRVFGYGGGVLEEDFTKAKHDDLPQVAVHDTGDAIIFYAQGVNKWSYNAANEIFTHKTNPYSTYGYYFITSDNVQDKKRIEEKPAVQPEGNTVCDITEFVDYKLYEVEKENLLKSGREFFGEKFTSPQSSVDITFTFPNVIKSTDAVRVNINLAATSQSASIFDLSLNGVKKTVTVPALGGSDNYLLVSNTTKIVPYEPSQDILNFKLALTTSTTAYLNYMEVNARRSLIMSGSAMQFNNMDNIGSKSYNRYHLTANSSIIHIWDITNPVNTGRMSTDRNGNALTFVDNASSVKSYMAVDLNASESLPEVEFVGDVATQNIHGMEPVDMLIITHPMFVAQANKLAQAHYDKDGLRVGVVTTEQVYNEFSSGTPDVGAYRWAAKMFYDKPENEDDKLKYLLLFGKGTYDNRGIMSNSGNNLVLTYQSANSYSETNSYVSDDYFGFMDDKEGVNIHDSAHKLDIGIGRFPVSTEAEAENVVSKTIAYMENKNKGGWKNQLCFIGDDGGTGNDGMGHMEDADVIAKVVGAANPAYQVNKIYLDAYQQETNASGERYPAAKTRFHNLVRSGLFLVTFMGHGSAGNWTNEQILTLGDINSFSNKNLGVWAAGTCNFSRFDKDGISGGEALLLNPIGGGIGSFSAARTVFQNYNRTVVKNFCEYLFEDIDGVPPRMGDVVVKAKNKSESHANKLSYMYFGDPALRLNYPEPYKVVTTQINEKQVVPTHTDTLRALSVATIKGMVTDVSGNLNEDFNGNLQVLVFDKEQNIKSLDNHKENLSITYKERPNTIFTGKAKVVDGKFEFTFMLPKDIRYNYGTGRLNFYAWDDDNEYEGQGYCEDFIIGGSIDNPIADNEGPEIVMYLNHSGFISGEKVNETPVFTAYLQDNNGINIAGSSPGHDIMLSIDQDPKYWFTLNEYYEAEEGSYQRGMVKFQLPEISEGKHILTFRVWDLLNNPSERILEFEVVKALTPDLFSVTTYPNPATSIAYIKVNHDRGDEIINVNVDVYDLSGKRIWTFNDYVIDNTIQWDLMQGNGQKVSAGMYIYRVSVETNDKKISTKSNKIIVTE